MAAAVKAGGGVMRDAAAKRPRAWTLGGLGLLALAGLLGGAGEARAQYHGDTQLVRCESDDGRYRVCPAETRGRIWLERQRSRADCVEGRTWGVERGGIWVDQGCRADFRVETHRPGPGPRPPGPGWGGPGPGGPGPGWGGGRDTVVCGSPRNRFLICDVDTRGGVRLVQQHSRAACVEGSSWGFDRRGIWVDHGCEATFELGRGGGGGWRGEEVRCGSPRYAYLECPIDTRRGVFILQQHSSTACIEGRTWGYARRGIWVDRGCDATFGTGRR